MNNNNNNRGNNRRRGRNNNRQQGGGQNLNRIDSRARGNAPQMLDKYKKLAEESHRNGDRVQAEYYLQFADHYFRVIADGKPRQDDQPQQQQRGRRDDDRDRYDDRFEDSDGDGQDNDNDAEQEAEAAPPRRNPRRDENNPFTRETRNRRPRGDDGAQRGDDSAPRRNAGDGAQRDETEDAVTNEGGLDPQALPPAIGESDERPRRRSRLAIADSVDDDEAPRAPSAPVGEEEPKPKRRGRPRKVRPEDGEVAQVING